MTAFRYQAQNLQGETASGIIEADSARQVRQQLRAQGLTPLSVDAVEQSRSSGRQWLGSELSQAEVVLLTRQLASLLQARLPLARALIDAAPDRCVWASDWPYLKAPYRLDYGPMLKTYETMFTPQERHQLMWASAQQHFGFGT